MEQHKRFGNKLDVFHTAVTKELVGRTVLTRFVHDVWPIYIIYNIYIINIYNIYIIYVYYVIIYYYIINP